MRRYTADQIVSFSAIEGIRLRPLMYLGATGAQGLHSLLNELFNSTLEEFRSGHATQLSVRLHPDGSLTWSDDGRPLGTEPLPRFGGSTEAEAALTELGTGPGPRRPPRRSDTLYFVIANALRRRLRLETGTGSDRWSIECARGEIVRGPLRAGHSAARGLSITFCPDAEIFGDASFDFDTIAVRLRELSFLNSGLSVELVGERTGRSEQFHSVDGPSDFVRFLNSDQTVLYPEILRLAGVFEGVHVEVALQHRADFDPLIRSYANSHPTPEGGTHLNGFLASLTLSLTRYALRHGIVEDVLRVEDYLDGLTAVVSVHMPDVQFIGASRTALGSGDAETAVASIVYEQLSEFLEHNSAIAEQTVSKASTAAAIRSA